MPTALVPSRLRGIVLALLPPALVLMAWWELTRGFFFSDDFQILYELGNGNLLSLLLEPEWRHVNTTRNALLAVEYFLFGPRPGLFYAVALMLHFVNAALLYRLAHRVTGQPGLSSAVAAIWVLSPLHVGTLGWCAANGHALIATFLFWMLGRVAALEADDRAPTLRDASMWGLGMVAVATSYGVGLSMALAFPVLAFAIIGRSPERPVALALAAVMAVLLAGYLILVALYPVPETKWTARVAPPLSSILSQPAAIVLLGLELAKAGASALLLGPFFRPEELPPFAMELVSAGFAALLLAALWLGTPRDRRWLGGLTLLALAGYAGVAVGKGFQWAEEPIRGALEARYHYAPQAMLALVVVVALTVLRRRSPRVVVFAAVACSIVLAAGLLVRPLEMRAHHHERRTTHAALAEIRKAISETPPGQTAYIPNRFFDGMAFLSEFQEKWAFPGLAGLYVIFFESDELDGRRVRFVAIEPEQMAATQAGGRIATLLVPGR